MHAVMSAIPPTLTLKTLEIDGGSTFASLLRTFNISDDFVCETLRGLMAHGAVERTSPGSRLVISFLTGTIAIHGPSLNLKLSFGDRNGLRDAMVVIHTCGGWPTVFDKIPGTLYLGHADEPMTSGVLLSRLPRGLSRLLCTQLSEREDALALELLQKGPDLLPNLTKIHLDYEPSGHRLARGVTRRRVDALRTTRPQLTVEISGMQQEYLSRLFAD